MSIITNCWGKAKTSRLAGKHTVIYKAAWDASYSHHPQITSYKGRLFATWSLGHRHEDTPGQKMVYATSDDLGNTWSEPITLAAPAQGENTPECLTSFGIFVSGDTMAAYYINYDFTLEALLKFAEFGACAHGIPGLRFFQNVYTGVMQSDDGGATWKGPVAKIPNVWPNLSPVRISTGRLIIPSYTMFPYTDDPTGLSGWKVASLPGLPEGYYDGAGGHLPIKAAWGDLGICEGSLYELPGGILRMMLRTSKGRLAVSESKDFGETWSAPELTEFTDCGSRFQFGKLPDGRYFALTCPDPNIPESCLRRTPLVLALSEDGNVFDRHYIIGDEPDMPLRFPGESKHGRYGYPYSYILGDKLFIVNSVGKEDVELRTYDLKDIS